LEEDAKADEEEESGVMRESSPLGVGGGDMKATFFSTTFAVGAAVAPDPAPQGGLPLMVSFPEGRPLREERGALGGGAVVSAPFLTIVEGFPVGFEEDLEEEDVAEAVVGCLVVLLLLMGGGGGGGEGGGGWMLTSALDGLFDR